MLNHTSKDWCLPCEERWMLFTWVSFNLLPSKLEFFGKRVPTHLAASVATRNHNWAATDQQPEWHDLEYSNMQVSLSDNKELIYTYKIEFQDVFPPVFAINKSKFKDKTKTKTYHQ